MIRNNIVITGVSTGIGRATLDLFHKNGYHIYGSVRKKSDADRLTKIYSDRFTPLIFDVQNHVDVLKASKIVFDECDHLTALINNAGIVVPGPLQHVSEENFEEQLDVNVKSMRRITNLFLPLLGAHLDYKYNPGRIINMSSISGLFSSPFNGSYSISKHAVESMTDVYRRELRQFGIKVISIEPGPIKTKIWQKNLNKMGAYEKTDYFNILQKADKIILNTEKNALPVERVSKVILKCATIKSPKARYIIHKNRFIFKLLAFYLPDFIADWLVHNSLTKANKHRPI
jgi:NAD(P)-dependent dehydrogenase (short-subunit alcohol dehydrogenase family)